MKKQTIALLTFGLGAVLLMSFVQLNDDDKKKRYHVMHQENGVMMEFDTVLPMGANYSVQDFLRDKGIASEEVEIIKMPFINLHHMGFHEEGMEAFEIEMEDAHMVDGTVEDVRIMIEEDDNGMIKAQKFVNGEEVELTPEELEQMKSKHRKRDVAPMTFRTKEGANVETVKISVEGEGDGPLTIKKYVNGQEVELTAEEREQLENEIDGHNLFIDMDEADEQLFVEMITLDESMEGLEQHMDSMAQVLEMRMVKELGEAGELDEEQRVVIRINHDEMHHVTGENEAEQRKVIREENVWVQSDQENFTVVLVTENIPADEVDDLNRVRMEVAGPDEIHLYPNPNDGLFTIGFEQAKEAQTTIEIHDEAGKLVFKDKLGKFKGKYLKEVDLKKHGAGTYLVTIQRGKELSSMKAIVK